jgi:hypothetical protein
VTWKRNSQNDSKKDSSNRFGRAWSCPLELYDSPVAVTLSAGLDAGAQSEARGTPVGECSERKDASDCHLQQLQAVDSSAVDKHDAHTAGPSLCLGSAWNGMQEDSEEDDEVLLLRRMPTVQVDCLGDEGDDYTPMAEVMTEAQQAAIAACGEVPGS